jgi:molybdenum cofactor guanylyltransferase
MKTAGFVLVGGQSRRMGRDKALLPWRSGVLVQHVASLAAAAAGDAVLVGNPERYIHLGLRRLTDIRPGLGPLSGIETALQSRLGDYNLVLACDMPDVSAQHLAELLRLAQRMDVRCVVTQDEAGRVHPLCAVYRLDCLPAVSKALDERRLKLLDLVDELGAEKVCARSPIRNVNTAEEWEAARTAHGF